MACAGPEDPEGRGTRGEACDRDGPTVDCERDPFLAHRDADAAVDDLFDGDW